MTPSAIWVGVVPGLILMGGVVGALIYYLVRVHPRGETPQGAKDWASMALLPAPLVGFFYTLLDPLMTLLVRIKVTPNQITLGSVIIAIVAAILFASGGWVWGAWVFALSAACDGLDGMLARRTERMSESGAFFDSFMDRLSEGIVLLGLAIYGQGSWLTWGAMCALIASYAVSYARARGESFGVKASRGLMQRPERMVILFLCAWGSPYLSLYLEPGVEQPIYHLAIAGTLLIAVGALWTALSRARFIFDTLRVREQASALY